MEQNHSAPQARLQQQQPQQQPGGPRTASTACSGAPALTPAPPGAAAAAAAGVVAAPLRTALLCIDVQSDFMPGGSLAVPRGDEVVAVINKLRRSCRDQLTLVVFTQDYHPPNHVSFASTHLPPPHQPAAAPAQPPPSSPPRPGSDQPPPPPARQYVRLVYDKATGELLDCSRCGAACRARRAAATTTSSLGGVNSDISGSPAASARWFIPAAAAGGFRNANGSSRDGGYSVSRFYGGGDVGKDGELHSTSAPVAAAAAAAGGAVAAHAAPPAAASPHRASSLPPLPAMPAVAALQLPLPLPLPVPVPAGEEGALLHAAEAALAALPHADEPAGGAAAPTESASPRAACRAAYAAAWQLESLAAAASEAASAAASAGAASRADSGMVGTEVSALLAAAAGVIGQGGFGPASSAATSGGAADGAGAASGAGAELQQQQGKAEGGSGLSSPLQRHSLIGASGATLQRHLEVKMEQAGWSSTAAAAANTATTTAATTTSTQLDSGVSSSSSIDSNSSGGGSGGGGSGGGGNGGSGCSSDGGGSGSSSGGSGGVASGGGGSGGDAAVSFEEQGRRWKAAAAAPAGPAEAIDLQQQQQQQQQQQRRQQQLQQEQRALEQAQEQQAVEASAANARTRSAAFHQRPWEADCRQVDRRTGGRPAGHNKAGGATGGAENTTCSAVAKHPGTALAEEEQGQQEQGQQEQGQQEQGHMPVMARSHARRISDTALEAEESEDDGEAEPDAEAQAAIGAAAHAAADAAAGSGPSTATSAPSPSPSPRADRNTRAAAAALAGLEVSGAAYPPQQEPHHSAHPAHPHHQHAHHDPATHAFLHHARHAPLKHGRRPPPPRPQPQPPQPQPPEPQFSQQSHMALQRADSSPQHQHRQQQQQQQQDQQERTAVVLQRLWPDHCLAGGPGSDLHTGLLAALPSDVILRKGARREVDGYSAFFDNGRLHQTPLHRQLRAAGVSRLLVTGVAAEHCVLWTVRDAVRLGYQVWVVSDGVRGMGGPAEAAAREEMAALPAVLVLTAEQVISAAAAWPNAEGLALEPPAAPDQPCGHLHHHVHPIQ
ncbi:hypothetical protein HYH02_008344 [Chlamydomonas schloesseri]|uniref:nicotinamidase n=1 Tax=Chlamydomonas schloesseri TaxID=2026947 RepID=A0A836B476_9CHLO|nr:hypothetical protein HYH02_008344 [Chlamydomonas schloesseri]|eukprot:KAG2446784.1 hypothetical protein HYH02_008344 [Chlamydomonas schloesseri]